MTVLHNGVKDTLNEVRAKFWIVKGRSFARKILHQCVICKKYEGRPCLGPSPPPLPRFRVAKEPPFSYTGVDFAGPLFVKTGKEVSSNNTWICLYTCCAVRAVHLDIVPDLTTSAFIRSLKRFSAHRGLPRRFVSDNGKTFKGAVCAIHFIIQHEDVQQYLAGRRIEWSFNIERAPWWGGFFERMVRMTKRCLKKMIGRARLTYDELVTAVTEVEAVINARPLSCITSDDLDEPLTPTHLLTGRRLLSLPDYRVEEDDLNVTPEHLSKRMLFLNKVIDGFWKRWKEYLLELRETHCYGAKTSEMNPLSTGEVVLVHDDNKPRSLWRLARVESLIVGSDGNTRVAVLTATTSGGRRISLRRPLQRLYPIEVKSKISNSDDEMHLDRLVREPDALEKQSQRPTRAAAQMARDRIKVLSLCEQNELDC